MRLVLIESPFFAEDPTENIAYARACMSDCFARAEYPFASHLTYPGILNDNIPSQRALGIAAGLAWGARADLTAVYTDLGISSGMQLGIYAAKAANRPVEFRTLGRVT